MWKIEWDSKALKEAKKLDRDARKKIVEYIEDKALIVLVIAVGHRKDIYL